MPALEIEIDLSPATIMRAARGNPANLPTFMVHDNHAWPAGVVRTDTKNRIHMRRSSFLNVVVPAVPVRPGLWHRVDMQEYHIDLRADQLGGDGTQAGAGWRATRDFATDRRLCPECGAWLETIDGVLDRRVVTCSACSWTDGTSTVHLDCSCILRAVKGSPVGRAIPTCRDCEGTGRVRRD